MKLSKECLYRLNGEVGGIASECVLELDKDEQLCVSKKNFQTAAWISAGKMAWNQVGYLFVRCGVGKGGYTQPNCFKSTVEECLRL